MNDLPNILILSQEIPQTVNAGSILLHRFLKDYPAEKIMVMGSRPHPDAELLKCRYEILELPFKRIEQTRFSNLVHSCRLFNLLPTFDVAGVELLLKGFKPDIVISVMQTQPFYRLASDYSQLKKIPLMLLVHDLSHTFEPVTNWAKKKQELVNYRVYNNAVKRLCISPEMERHFSQTYNAPGDVLYPNRSEDIVPRNIEESRALKQPETLTIGYAGSLAYGYGDRLKQMQSAFEATGSRIHIYSHQTSKGHALFDRPGDTFVYRGYAPTALETWSKVKQECDAVILPCSWSENIAQQNLYKTHFPSKLPEYLALGIPVILTGPKYATGVKWGLRNPDAALVVAENTNEASINALTKLKHSPELRIELSKNALVAGLRDFDPIAIKNQFFKHIQEAVNSNKVLVSSR